MHRLKIKGNILFGYVFTFIFSIIFIGASTVIFKNIYAVVFTAAIIFLLVFYVGKKYGKSLRLDSAEKNPKSIFAITEKQLNRFFIISVIAMFILQLTAGYFLKSTPVTDWMTIDVIAKNFAKSGNFENMYESLPAARHEYIARYTNNNGILVLLSLYYRIVYIIFGKVPSFAPVLFNALFINAAVVFTFFISKKLFKPFGSFLTLVICFLFLPYYTYVPYYYSDSLSLPFTVISVFLVLSGAKIKTDTKDKKRLVKKIVYLITAGFFIAVGYEIKGSLIIVTVGAVVYIILENKLKAALIGALSVTLSTLICISAINAYNDSLHFTTKEQLYEQQYPAIHWVMMGLKGDGGFDQSDATATRNSGNYDQKTEAIKKEIVSRLNKMGVNGMITHLYQKLTFTWGDGIYFIDHHLNSVDSNGNKIENRSILFEFVLRDGKYNAVFYVYSNTFHMCMLLFMVLSGFFALRRKKISKITLIQGIVFGATLFFMVWETRSRYIFNLTPLFILLSVDGLLSLWEHNAKLNIPEK